MYHLKHSVGSNPIIPTYALIVQRKEYEFPKLEMLVRIQLGVQSARVAVVPT